MDNRKNILIIDLRYVPDHYLTEFINDLGCDNISWLWLDNIIKKYECKHNMECDCCDGVASLKKRIKFFFEKENGGSNQNAKQKQNRNL